ncbi:hypothetical protein [Mesorhizobium sp.]|uniref:hypothetical protein n=1 Tax=Mesorhizobium sp. TaxID=1871066 RepID=UPI00257E2B91|nr:hypothetical protein [Mesorhizobium sp.]
MDAKATAAEAFVREPAAGSTLNVLGISHIYKATGAETAGPSRFVSPWFRRARERHRTPMPVRMKPSMC